MHESLQADANRKRKAEWSTQDFTTLTEPTAKISNSIHQNSSKERRKSQGECSNQY